MQVLLHHTDKLSDSVILARFYHKFVNAKIYIHIYYLFQCNPGVGLKSLFDVVHGAPRKVILFGDACSNVTETIAKAARHWNLVQVY